MAKKITLETLAKQLAKIDARTAKGFAALEERMEKGFAAVAGDIADIKERMATKADVRAIVREEIGELVPGIVALGLKPLRDQLKCIEDRLDTLDDHYANLKGVTKEIDEIRSEVRAIQKHLGIEKKIAA